MATYASAVANGTPNGTTQTKPPTHPGLFKVDYKPGAYTSRLISLIDAAPGTVICPITGTTPTGQRTYATVQVSRDSDIELNSDLVYCNHSCAPSVVFDMTRMEVRVAEGANGGKGLRKGDDMTFFYPSTEWDMTQAFTCGCGAKGCLGEIRGAKYLSGEVLGGYWLNGHVRELVEERDGR